MKVMVAGSSGMLGRQLMSVLGERGIGFDLPAFDVTDRQLVVRVVGSVKPDVILNVSAITDVDFCEKNPVAAERVHCTGVRNLASTGVRLVTVSTDQVFSRGNGRYLVESDPPSPANVYALTKLQGERVALESHENTVVRTSWLFGSRGLLPWIVRRLLDRGTVNAVTDQTSCITSVESLADALAGIAVDRECTGLYHCVNKGAITPYDLACAVRDRIGRGTVVPSDWKQLALPASRPVWSALGTERDIKMPELEEVMELCLKKML